MAADFEEEGRLANETVTRQSSNPNVMLGGVGRSCRRRVIGLMWYASGRKQTKPQNAGEEAFATARLQPGATFDRPRALSRPADNRFVIPSLPRSYAAGPQPPVVIPQGGPEPRPDDSEAKRLAELEKLRKEHEALNSGASAIAHAGDRRQRRTASVDPSMSRVSAEARRRTRTGRSSKMRPTTYRWRTRSNISVSTRSCRKAR